ncbi:MAG: glycoside hydrolase family 127 protein [Verrucomicrobiae bacterium]|nr:glycoside hydrolase family 127 protein [Verrucomicrobiae bacterium]
MFTTSLIAGDYPVRPVPFTDVGFSSGLLHDRQETNVKVTLPFALGQLESANRLKNFDLAAETMQRRAAGEAGFQNRPVTQYTFDDSDVYKVLEGAAFCLSVQADPELEKQLEGIIKRVAAAQEPDGYLYTWRTMHPDSPVHDWIGQKRWEKAPQLSHEFYNLGHLYEAGTAYTQATGSKSLMDICLKSAELLHHDFGDGKDVNVPGHQVVEMGLAKLYRSDGDQRWLDLARYFLESRRGKGGEYSQDHKPVLEQSEAVGHAVRANYMYAGMADVAALGGDQRYLAAINRIWENVVGKKLHLTGGVGARGAGEAYGDNYELPNRCYNETCAAIGFLFWNHRMFLMTGDAKYMDVFERTLYNGFLSGVSLSGDRFFYPNPLEYDGSEANNHGHAGRAPWFGCACCPPNMLRTVASIGGYAYAVKDRSLFVNLYATGDGKATVAGNDVTVSQETKYPWSGDVKLEVKPAKPGRFDLSLRVPGWVQGKPVPSDLYRYDDASPSKWTIQVNGKPVSATVSNGYARIDREWKSGDVVELHLPMPVRRVSSHPKIATNEGLVALERGPVVYAFEGVDNDGSVFDLGLPSSAKAKPVFKSDLLGGVVVLEVGGAKRVIRKDGDLKETNTTATAIPYAVWNNRGNSPMSVWLGRDSDHVRPAIAPNFTSKAKVAVSFSRESMDPGRLKDQQMPRNATDGFAAGFDFWPHLGGSEWITYEFEKPATVTGSTVSWFDDTGSGGACALPKSWKLSYQDSSGEWKPVERPSAYRVRKAEPVSVEFKPVTTKALRLDIELEEGRSAGLYEWQVETR